MIRWRGRCCKSLGLKHNLGYNGKNLALKGSNKICISEFIPGLTSGQGTDVVSMDCSSYVILWYNGVYISQRCFPSKQ